jgi:serine kinase of HPr protein (carbohydrate metabolism regulator)
MPALSSERLHASCVAIGGQAVLIEGRSGSGKSDLALRLIDRGAVLVSDDQVIVRREGTRALAAPPETIAGKIEVRGLGIVTMPVERDVPVALLVRLVEGEIERMPDGASRTIAGVAIPEMVIRAFEASAAAKVVAALSHHASSHGPA